MFDIFCHKITFIFSDVQIDVNDLIDIIGEVKGLSVPQTKKQLVAKLNAIIEKRHHDSLPKKSTDV